ncbi:hypothetical protein LMG28614_00660 [Paraburkholderia ultramafica]|uniref:Uncharacterized protein n=1 Tax=Paraburkholderia ultramafica TaxID=1544867 RepID=A0A6S7C0P5_9BURK|nr:hypothetical protein [Paraburkholderia ultramafica]CAB3778590.1 hypothetical protein LMG28614_00660 [Paraburkholderia ultramafica]
MNTEAVNAKARDLMAPVLSARKTDQLIERIKIDACDAPPRVEVSGQQIGPKPAYTRA